MARLSIYVPDGLAAEARAAELNVSALAQHAIEAELGPKRVDAWLDEVCAGNTWDAEVSDEVHFALLDEARAAAGDHP